MHRGMQWAEQLILIKAFLGGPSRITSVVVAIS
jgi:hypothetical protein